MLGQVRTCKQSEAVRKTHRLERVDVGTGQDMQTKRGSKGDSPTGEGRCWDWSGHANKARQRAGLTIWRG